MDFLNRKIDVAFARWRARRKVGYGDITLRKEGQYAIVSIDVDGRQVDVIQKHVEENFYECITPLGMVDVVKGEMPLGPRDEDVSPEL